MSKGNSTSSDLTPKVEDPVTPTNLSLKSPPSSPANDSTPTITVGGVASGQNVKVYSDSNCLHEIGAAVSEGASVDVTIQALVDGSYTFFSKVIGAHGVESSCSTSSIIYVLDSTISSISYTQPTSFASKNQAMTSLAPSISGSVNSFSISPALPAGIAIDGNTGVISGTPTLVSPPTTYTISASSIGGNVTTTVVLEVPLGITVNSTLDAADAAPGNEVCATAGSVCTLRAAVQEAAALGANTLVKISVPTGTYTLSSTGLQVTSRVQLTGAGLSNTIITAANAFATVININTTSAVTIDGVTIRDGRLSTNGAYTGVGIRSISNEFVLKNCEISGHNILATVIGVTAGIGVYWMGGTGSTFLMDNCKVSGNSQSNAINSAEGYGAGLYLTGSGQFTIQNSTILNNTLTLTGTFAKTKGGGIFYNIPGHIYKTQFAGNSQNSNFAAHGGGGVFASLASGLTTTIEQVTFASNTGRYGGGLQFDGPGKLIVTESTFNENQGLLAGDGMYVRFCEFEVKQSTFLGSVNKGELVASDFGSALSKILNSTFYSNGGSANINLGYGSYSLENVTSQKDYTSGVALAFSGDSLTVKNSILDKTSTSSACSLSGTTMTSGGYNIARDGTCSTLLTGTGDMQNSNPQLQGLTANGGKTYTMAIGAASPAYNMIPSGSCTLSTDQNGSSRPYGGACDAGAFEFQGVLTNDPYYSDVLVHMHCDGTLTDQKSNTISNNGITISNTQSKFGSDSCAFNGSAYATMSNALFASGTLPFTFEAWVYTTSAAAEQGIGSTSYQGSCSSVSSGFSLSSSSILMGTSSASCYELQNYTAISQNTWHHMAYVYDGANMSVYIDGTRVSILATTRTMTSPVLVLGRYYVNYSSYYMDGYIDEIRFTRGVPRYLGPTYVVPTSAFPNN